MTPEQIKAAAQRNSAKKAQERFRLAPLREQAKNAATLLRERRAGAVQRIAEVKQMSELVYIPGFFPTPKALVSRMMELARIEPGMKCLEPSAGKGDIADAMRAAGADVSVCECNYKLREILTKKGYTIIADDFTEMPPVPIYNVCVMNSPFEHGQDRKHVMHAYKFLKPGGRLVAIVSEGCFSRSLKADVEFRKWLDEIGADNEQNPDDSFNGAYAERRTGVRTRIVVIDKD